MHVSERSELQLIIFVFVRTSLNQLTAFQQQSRTPSHYLQSTTLTATSGLGSNYTSYTTDPMIDFSMGSLADKRAKFHQANAGTSSSFLESDLPTTDEYLYVPEGEHPRFMSPHRMNQNYESNYGGELDLINDDSSVDITCSQMFTFPTSIPT